MKNRIPEMYGSLVFGDDAMKAYLPEDVYLKLKQTMKDGRRLDVEIADAVASAMKDWATEHGATHYTHWFQPMTGITAEKHDSFIHPTKDGKVIMVFKGKELMRGETDGSSLPNGGLRSTFEARGYTAWDPSAYAFIKDHTLCIPTVFYAYGGEALDKKTPLLRSVDAINKQTLRILKLFGKDDVKRVTVTVGAEQEYFLINRHKYYLRPDLVITGRTLFGARPSKGQEMEDHYFGTIKPKVMEFMTDLDEELWKLGIPAKTEHNEVAPAQHELAPVFEDCNNALDDNQLMMESMKKVARRHGLACLLHEKPFAGVNGSGKHNNWSLTTDTGINLLEPGESPSENAQFLLFLCAVIKAVDDYQDLLRVSVASASNDHRLGGNEAPPAILSMFLGDELKEILDTIEQGSDYQQKDRQTMTVGVHILPRIPKDTTDRNRTSPFAFTGNKFEFRMPGSGASISDPDVIINTIVAESLCLFADELEAKMAEGVDFTTALNELIVKVIRQHKRILFNGNNYSNEWHEEAMRRGLKEAKTTVDALPAYLAEKNIALFDKHHIFTKAELESRYEISLESYIKTVNLEALTMIDMTYRDILPAVSGYVNDLCQTALNKQQLLGGAIKSHESRLVERLSDLSSETYSALEHLEAVVNSAKSFADMTEQGHHFRDEVVPAMAKLREAVDGMEFLTSEEKWPYPNYRELLFYV